MDELKRILEPVVERLPPGAREWLDGGGWNVVLGVAAVVLFLVLWGVFDRLFRRLLRRRRPIVTTDPQFQEDLGGYGLLLRSAGEHQLMVYHVPVRLRLVVIAPAGTEVEVDSKGVRNLLDQVVPDASKVWEDDRPRVRVWPPQLSKDGFAVAFFRHVRRPEPEGEPSNWILVAGRAQLGRQAVLVGLALWSETPTTLGRLTLEPHQWLDVLRIKTATV